MSGFGVPLLLLHVDLGWRVGACSTCALCRHWVEGGADGSRSRHHVFDGASEPGEEELLSGLPLKWEAHSCLHLRSYTPRL